jgi:Tol biopolymer transport system component
MKKNVFKGLMLLSLLVTMALLLPSMVHAQSGKANFNGNWSLNESKSQLPEGGGGRMMGSSNFSVNQDANVLTRTSTGRDGSQRVSKYNLDGKESVNTTPRGDSKSVATWSPDGKTLNIATTRQTDNGERKSSESWTLTNPTTLTIISTFATQDGERKATMVYDKK